MQIAERRVLTNPAKPLTDASGPNEDIRRPNGPLRRSSSDFDEASYLEANPDVAEAVRDGRYQSGSAHWLDVGRIENRPLRMLMGNGDAVSPGRVGSASEPLAAPPGIEIRHQQQLVKTFARSRAKAGKDRSAAVPVERHAPGKALHIDRDALAAAFDAKSFLRQVRHFFPAKLSARNCAPDAALALYLADAELRRLSPNPIFDEGWYRSTYQDVGDAISGGILLSGFQHFVQFGYREGRFPNAILHGRAAVRLLPMADIEGQRFDSRAYLSGNPEAADFIRHFPQADAHGYYQRYGRWIDTLAPKGSIEERLLREFDEAFYTSTYPVPNTERPFEHYLRRGSALRHSPNAWFDEAWYVAFYKDVSEAIESGQLLSGFHHYLAKGREEGRLPKDDPVRALESAIPGITAPVLCNSVANIEAKLAPIPVDCRANAIKTLWCVIPRLNPDITFGGYRAFFELARSLKAYAAKRGFSIKLLITEELAANRNYFLWRCGSGVAKEVVEDLKVISRYEIDRLTISPKDRFLSYSAWDTILAADVAKFTDQPRVLSLIQEYEPIFYESSSLHALTRSAFTLPSYPIFNSSALCSYFKQNRLGLFATNPSAELLRDYAVFEHVFTSAPRPRLKDLKSRRQRTMLVYARPERHAMRNLYEIVEIALRRLCQAGKFSDRWRFIGVGCLTDLKPRQLGGGHRLEFVRKLPEADYTELLRSADLGISLMYAPHPGLVHFEFATSGAMVVTNAFDNRSPEWLRSISPNIVPCEPSIDGLMAAVLDALARVDDFQSRVNGALRPPAKAWSQTFDQAFLDSTVANLLS